MRMLSSEARKHGTGRQTSRDKPPHPALSPRCLVPREQGKYYCGGGRGVNKAGLSQYAG